MAKSEKRNLISEFFSIPHSYARASYEKMIEKLESYNKFQDERDQDVDRLVLLAKAQISYDKNRYSEEIYKILEPIFEYLSDLESWKVVDLKICCMIVRFAENYEEASLLVDRTLEELKKFRPEQFPEKLIVLLHTNLIARIVHADYFEADYSQSLELDLIFNETFKKAYLVAKEYNYKDILAFLYTMKGLFEDDSELINEGLELAEECSEGFYKYIEKTISIHKR